MKAPTPSADGSLHLVCVECGREALIAPDAHPRGPWIRALMMNWQRTQDGITCAACTQIEVPRFLGDPDRPKSPRRQSARRK